MGVLFSAQPRVTEYLCLGAKRGNYYQPPRLFFIFSACYFCFIV